MFSVMASLLSLQNLWSTLVLAALVPFAPVDTPVLHTSAPQFSTSVHVAPAAPAAAKKALPVTQVATTTASTRQVSAPLPPPRAADPIAPTHMAPLTPDLNVAAAPSVDKVVAALQKTYEKTDAFSATFTQRYTSTLLKRTDESTGTVAFKKPGLMRWDYTAPSKKSFVIDGERLWVHQPEDNLAMVDNCFKQDGLTASVRFLWGAGDIKKDFDVSWFSGVFGKKTDHHLLLTPKTKNGIFVKLILVVDPKTYRVQQSVVVDPQGNVNQFAFADLNFKPTLSAKDFAMDLPKTTAVSRIPGSCVK